MIVLPGGGFYAVATDLEGTEVCDWVVQQGMTCVMLKYRTPLVWPKENGKQQRPKVLLGLEDAQRAMGLLRQRASTYGIDPHKIGVIGFSAGAYLVANMSNAEERAYPLADAADHQSPRPDFAIVAYTARMLDTSAGKNSLELKPWVKISAKAPPTLIIHAMNDPVDDIREPMAYALELNDAGVSVDVRLYAKGSQFTSMAFTSVLLREKIAISMDGRGAWRDNVFVERLWRSVKRRGLPASLRLGQRRPRFAGPLSDLL